MRFSRYKNRVLALAFTAFPLLARLWAKRLQPDEAAIPWSPPGKPLRDAKVALVTTGGVHLVTDPPFDMINPDGDPSYREVSTGSDPSRWKITHDYYNHRDADRDINLVLPVGRLRELERRAVIGALHSPAYSYMGHIDGARVKTLVHGTAIDVARKLAAANVDYALLVPA